MPTHRVVFMIKVFLLSVAYVSMLCFLLTALGAGGVDKRSWTQPNRGPSMLTLHGKAYHRIFDLQQQYEDMNFRIVAEFIYSTVSLPTSVLLES